MYVMFANGNMTPQQVTLTTALRPVLLLKNSPTIGYARFVA